MSQEITPWVPEPTWPTRRIKRARWIVVRKMNGVACYFHKGSLSGQAILFGSKSSAQARADKLNKDLPP